MAKSLKRSYHIHYSMGIPSYFSFIVKNHSTIIKRLRELRKPVDNFYLDSNSIIYDSLRRMQEDYGSYSSDSEFEDALIASVCRKIDEYIGVVKPRKHVFIAFDGVAPVAKLEQQRNRRYKSSLERSLRDTLKGPKPCWDQTAITPGTGFMSNLGETIAAYYKYGHAKALNVDRISVSTSDEPGEGEHKIFGHIRGNAKVHANQVTLVYGLDADLIMLGLNHLPVAKHIYLYRETPEFIKSIDRSLEPDVPYILDLPLLANAIIEEMSDGRRSNSKQQANRLYDYIFLCFFLGNDFMPHFPAINIRTRGIDIMKQAYKETIGNTNSNLTDGRRIYWGNVWKLVKHLAGDEYDNLMEEYRIRGKWERRYYPAETADEKLEKLTYIPTKEREDEYTIAPTIRNWQHRYYQVLFDTDITHSYKKKICTNYLEGLEWTMRYYTTGCPDWRWCYKYHYGPILKDLLAFIPRSETSMIRKNRYGPVTPECQLSYVLPLRSLGLLRKDLHLRLLRELPYTYGEDFPIKWAFCKYFWEAHVDLPPIDLNRLERVVAASAIG